MKKIVFLFLICSSFSFGQHASSIAKVENSEKLSASKSSGEFYFTLPEELSPETIAKNAAFYTEYFTVDYDVKKHVAKIKMVQNTENARHIIVRFLVASQIKLIAMDNTQYKVEEFYQKFIK